MSAQLQGIGMTSRRTRMRLVQRLRESGIESARVLEIIGEVPRHIFLDEALAHRAYEDTSLPIGYGQTLSRPYIVARMTEILQQHGPARILELGTGSGYQTAVLSQLFEEVYSVERIRPLQDRARDRLRQLGVRNVLLKHADGGMGWPERGPFDGIIVTAAPGDVPRELLVQLADNGVLVAPVGEEKQVLLEVVRRGEHFERRELEPVHFVPLLGGVIRRKNPVKDCTKPCLKSGETSTPLLYSSVAWPWGQPILFRVCLAVPSLSSPVFISVCWKRSMPFRSLFSMTCAKGGSGRSGLPVTARFCCAFWRVSCPAL